MITEKNIKIELKRKSTFVVKSSRNMTNLVTQPSLWHLKDIFQLRSDANYIFKTALLNFLLLVILEI